MKKGNHITILGRTKHEYERVKSGVLSSEDAYEGYYDVYRSYDKFGSTTHIMKVYNLK